MMKKKNQSTDEVLTDVEGKYQTLKFGTNI